MFVDKLVSATPNLRYLSMLGNEACPNFLNNGTLAQYNDYRKYTIHRLRTLTQLDADPVTEKERAEAVRLYGALQATVAQDEEARAIEAQEAEAQEYARIQKEKEAKQKRMEDLKQRKLKKLELQRKKREEAALQEIAAVPLPVPEVLVEEVTAKPTTTRILSPLLLANPTLVDGPPLPTDLAAIESLTDDEDWSDEDPEVEAALLSTEALLLSPPPSTKPSSFEDSDDDDWE